MTAQPGFMAKWLPSPKLLLGLSFMSLPIAYIIKKHLDWKPRPDSKKRMLIHHLVFWTSGVPALKFLHRAWGQFERDKLFTLKEKVPGKVPAGSSLKVAGWLAAAAGTLIGGFEGGERLAKALVPKPPKSMAPATGNTPMPVNSIPPVFPQSTWPRSALSPLAARPIPMTYSPSTALTGISLK
jgi:hypothetical protein